MSNLHYYRSDWITPTDESLEVDVCVYGGTAGGVIAATTAARRGRSVVLLHPGKHLGGMTTGGLGWTDFGSKHVIGGAARGFYERLGRHYGKEAEWQFEPSAATKALEAILAEHPVDIRLGQYLDRVHTENRRIAAVTLLGGLRVRARVLIDASYEGDLMAGAGVTYTVGREANSVYNETLNGIQCRDKHQFSHPVDPYRTPGDPESGLLPFVEPHEMTRHVGEGDSRIQAYNFRVCMTDDPDLRIPFPKPRRWRPEWFELATRWFNSDKDAYNEPLASGDGPPQKFDILPHKTPGGFYKTDTNNHGPVSSDFIGGNHEWPEAGYALRERIFQAHLDWQQGFYWHMVNSPEIPARYREAYARWGLARDEYADTEHWPHQLYVREARRLIGAYVVTEHECTAGARPGDSIGMASYTMDSHNCSRFVKIEAGRARVLNEGDVQVSPAEPYPLSYRSIVPRPGECENLFVPVCMAASHIAFGSIRMEPVFMVLGESAAIAADLCLEAGCPVQDLDYTALRPELLEAGQVLSLDGKQ